MIKGSIREEAITIVNINTLNIVPPQYNKANDIALKGKIYSNPIIMVGFNTPPTSKDIIQTENH